MRHKVTIVLAASVLCDGPVTLEPGPGPMAQDLASAQ